MYFDTLWITKSKLLLILKYVGAILFYIKRYTLLKKLTRTPLIKYRKNETENDKNITKYRTSTGINNNLKCPVIGTINQSFGNITHCMIEKKYDIYDPKPSIVADILLTRNKEKKIVGANLFVTSWIQFMTHDWFNHVLTDNEINLREKMTINSTKFYQHSKCKYSINSNSSFWDGGQIYNDNLRTHDGTGNLKLPNGYLPIKNNIEELGFNNNIWFGLSLLHLLFVKEHNSICSELVKKYPNWSDDKLYNISRLIVTGIIAKIHVVEWTCAILPNEITSLNQNISYNGIIGENNKRILENNGVDFSKIKLPFGINDIIFGYHKGPFNNDGVNFTIIEEFASIYKMHSLLPDKFKIYSHKDKKSYEKIKISDTLFENSKIINQKYCIDDLIYSFGKNNSCKLELNNYPVFMRNLKLQDDKIIDLACADILRDRERQLPRYNEFRTNLDLSPIKHFEDLTNDKELLVKLKEIYSNDIDKLDLIIGTYLEPKIPKCIFGETIYNVFVLQTLRRITNDRFFTTDFNSKIYTKFGIDYIENITFKKLLSKHFPCLEKSIPTNAFGIFI